MTHSAASVIVIGAGVAGLAAARRLQAAGTRVLVLEQAAQVGGRVRTNTIDGFPIDMGAAFTANFYSHTRKLARELGIERDLLRIPGSAAVLRGGQLHRLWPNLRVLQTRLVSLRSKLALRDFSHPLLRRRAELDLHAFHKAYAFDTRSIAEYAQAGLGDDVLEYLLQPALAGIFYWTPEHTSQALLFIALKAGLSLSGMELSTWRHGMAQLPLAMARGITVQLGARVECVASHGRGYTVRAQIGGEPREFRADGVVCATTASVVPAMFPELNQHQRDFFEAIHYSSNVMAALGTDHRLPHQFYGMFLPRRETDLLASVTVQSAKNPAQTPPGRDALVLHASGPASRALLHADDATIQAALLAELRRTLPRYDVGSNPAFARVFRWAEALPEFDVGHFKRLKLFADGLVESRALAFAGDYLGGPFIEGALTSGLEAADRLLDVLSQPTHRSS